MSVQSALTAALERAITFNKGTLTFNGVSVTVYKSFLRNQNREMQEVGYEVLLDDLMVMGDPDEITKLNLVPMQSEVTLDGVKYMVGRTVTTTPGYVSVWLRIKK